MSFVRFFYFFHSNFTFIFYVIEESPGLAMENRLQIHAILFQPLPEPFEEVTLPLVGSKAQHALPDLLLHRLDKFVLVPVETIRVE